MKHINVMSNGLPINSPAAMPMLFSEASFYPHRELVRFLELGLRPDRLVDGGLRTGWSRAAHDVYGSPRNVMGVPTIAGSPAKACCQRE